jgi:hypothetical protein
LYFIANLHIILRIYFIILFILIIYLALRQYRFYAYNLKIIMYIIYMKNTQFSKYIDAVLTQYSTGSISKEVAM